MLILTRVLITVHALRVLDVGTAAPSPHWRALAAPVAVVRSTPNQSSSAPTTPVPGRPMLP